MEKSRTAITLGLSFLIIVLLTAPTTLALSSHSPLASHAPLAVRAPAGPVPMAAPAAPLSSVAPANIVPANSTFPRTVLIETFTAVWCIHCPAETEALHNIDDHTSRNAVDIAELHVCAFAPGQGPCDETYVPPDNTSTLRGNFYGVCGYPDVFFDGLYNACGATNSWQQMEGEYNSSIANATEYPGNVSISQTATVDGSNVVEHAQVLSGITGSYNAVSYLLEYIDKLNVNIGYGPHDVDHVVRETLYNHPVNLVAGQVTDISASGALNSTWNTLNLSVVTFIQQNSTKIVENANQVPVTTLTTAVTANRTTLVSNDAATVTVTVDNSTTSAPLVGAAVNLSAYGGGNLTPSSGVTGADGTFTAAYTAPTVTYSTDVLVNASVSAPGYTNDLTTLDLVVNPLLTPDVPTSLTVAPGNGQVALNWTTPASGGAGVMYHIYRASTEGGTYTELLAQYATSYVDTTVAPGQAYWYKVSAQNTAGFSANTTAVSAIGLTVMTTGLGAYTGYWIFIDSKNFSAATNGSLPLYLPNGYYAYTYGPRSYAYLATSDTGAITVAGAPVSITAAFTPRYAGIQGTVSPSDATVTINGAPVTVSAGSFVDSLAAGVYAINVTAPGYTGNVTNVTLTPGNVSTVTVNLVKLPGSTGATSAGTAGLTSEDLIVIVVGAVFVLAAVVGGAMLMSSRGRRPPRSGNARSNTGSPPPESPEGGA
jgi:PEGA domain-containing protein